jgi:hypothetical protein
MVSETDYTGKLRKDIIHQFKGKPKTDVMLRAFARQFDELHTFFYQLDFLRHLQNAQGVQLDGIGDIVVLSRVQAAQLENMRTGFTGVIDDEIYRMWLRYKIFLNTFDGTYKSFMQNIETFWDKTLLFYSENPERPATIFLDTPEMEGTFNPEELFKIPVVKPSGVQVIIQAHTLTETEPLELYTGGITAGKYTVSYPKEIPQETIEIRQYIGTSTGVYTVTNLPALTTPFELTPRKMFMRDPVTGEISEAAFKDENSSVQSAYLLREGDGSDIY